MYEQFHLIRECSEKTLQVNIPACRSTRIERSRKNVGMYFGTSISQDYNYFARWLKGRKIIDRSSEQPEGRAMHADGNRSGSCLTPVPPVVFQRLQNSYPDDGVEVFLITES